MVPLDSGPDFTQNCPIGSSGAPTRGPFVTFFMLNSILFGMPEVQAHTHFLLSVFDIDTPKVLRGLSVHKHYP